MSGALPVGQDLSISNRTWTLIWRLKHDLRYLDINLEARACRLRHDTCKWAPWKVRTSQKLWDSVNSNVASVTRWNLDINSEARAHETGPQKLVTWWQKLRARLQKHRYLLCWLRHDTCKWGRRKKLSAETPDSLNSEIPVWLQRHRCDVSHCVHGL